jgi:ABC-type sugar transport system substrate-binding protein
VLKRTSVLFIVMALLLAACSSGGDEATEITLGTSPASDESATSSTDEVPQTSVTEPETVETEPESPRDLQEFARNEANERLASGGDYLQQEALAVATTPGQIIELRCAVALCEEVGSGIAEAAALLGWSHEVLEIGDSETSVSGTWAVVAERTERIVSGDVPTIVIAAASAPEWSAPSIQTLVDAGVPVLTYGGSDGGSAPGVSTHVLEESEFYRRGALLADIALSEGEGAIRFLAVDDLPLISVMRQGFEDELARICFENCSLDVVPMTVAALIDGSAEASILEAAALPEPPVVVVALEQALSGSATALSASVVELPLIVTQGTGEQSSELSAAGVRVVTVGSSAVAAGWHLVDQGLRLAQGVGATEVPTERVAGTEISQTVVPWTILIEDSLAAVGPWSPSPGPQEHFGGLWGR